MKHSLRIGFIDYRPDVGHASNFLRRIRNRFEMQGCEVVAVNAMETEIGRAWAKTQDVPYFECIEDFQGKVDGIMIPAASHPEHHRELFERSMNLGVPVFIDKPLAPDAQTGMQIFALAKEHHIPLFSSSSLRFSDEVKELQSIAPCMVQAWGGWSEKFDEFLIHPIEATMSLLGSDVRAVRRFSIGTRHHIELLYPQGRRGDIYFWPGAQPYEITACGEAQWKHCEIASPIFERLLDQIFSMFESGQSPIPTETTLTVLKVMDACRNAEEEKEISITRNASESDI